MSSRGQVVIVGAGLAGLACAVELHRHGRQVRILEASDGPGGRVRTDRRDGFTLDRGFQIYLTAYPEGGAMLDSDALDLRRFAPGAIVRIDGEFHQIGDPLRSPADIMATLRAPVGSISDKLRIGALAARSRFGNVADDLTGPDVATLAHLRDLGFSSTVIDRFFRPLFSGIMLDHDLETSSRVFRFVFRMLATGDSAVPAAGMEAIPRQLVDRLPAGSIEYGKRVTSVAAAGVHTEDGEDIAADAVVVAVDGPSAAALTGVADPGSRSVSCVYYDAPRPPYAGPYLVLNGDGRSDGPITNLAVMSNVAPSYAPPGRALIAVASLDGDDGLEAAVRRQLLSWYGDEVTRWRHLATYHIPHAQPRQVPPFHVAGDALVDSGLYVAGDYRATASINGALGSGRSAAKAVLAT